jgi:2,4-dienoyl-CoA reductase (NADPH2)
MGRALIADPLMPEKVRSGREDRVVHCIACAQGCFDQLFKLEPVQCLCNPKAGHEAERRIEKTSEPMRVMVIGGGAAGMSAALAAHERGHAVRLYEAGDRLGGQLFLAGRPPGREEFLGLARDLAQQVDTAGIEVFLNTPVDAALLTSEKPDRVILATGALPLTVPIPGIDRPQVLQAWDVLQEKADTGRRVAIIGGGAVGVETALFLAEKGTLTGEQVKFLLVNRVESPEDLYELATKGTREVILLEMLDRVGQDIGKSTRWVMMQDLSRLGVAVRTATRAVEITETGVTVETADGVEDITADSVVLALGSKSRNELQDALQATGIPFQVVGDAGRIGLALDAVHGGFAAGAAV